MATERPDPYSVLGVGRDADADAIRKAYRALARKYHPDVNPDDTAAEERFKQVSEAYSVVGDEEKRALYDEFGPMSLEAGFDAEAARAAREAFGARSTGGPDGTFSFGSLDDLLGGLFGGGRGTGTPFGADRMHGMRGRGGMGGFAMPGSDLEATLELDFLEAARGCEKSLSITRPAADGSQKRESVTVRIPAGVADGGRIRLPGKGGEGHGGAPAGDLFARIKVRPHPYFRREKRDLLLELPVTFAEAALGAKVEVPTLEGRATLTVPPGTNSGTRLRLRGKGIPHPRGGAGGDLYVTVQIHVPRELDDDARAQVAELSRLDPQPLRRPWDA